MKKNALLGGILVAVILVIVLAIRIVSGAAALAGGLFQTLLGIVIVLALVVIVVWMFSYAKKSRK